MAYYASMPQVRFDDVDAIESLVSEEFGPFGPPVTVTQEMINRFADVTNDHQWIHVDEERAAASSFGGTIAHGFLLLSLLPGMSDGSDTKLTGMSSVVNYGADKLRFTGAVRAGSAVHLRRRIAAVLNKPKGTQLTTESELRVVDAARPALIYRSLALYLP